MIRYVLLVEDDLLTRKLLSASLSRRGWDVNWVDSVQEARRCLAEKSTLYELLVLDLSLPDGNGQELANELRADPEYKKCWIIGFTGSIDHQINLPCFDAVLPKNQGHIKLISIIDSLLVQRS